MAQLNEEKAMIRNVFQKCFSPKRVWFLTETATYSRRGVTKVQQELGSHAEIENGFMFRPAHDSSVALTIWIMPLPVPTSTNFASLCDRTL